MDEMTDAEFLHGMADGRFSTPGTPIEQLDIIRRLRSIADRIDKPARENDLDKLAALEKNWDGEDAEPPHQKAIDSARKLLEHTPSPDRMLPLADGGIILEWQPKDAAIFEIEVDSIGCAELMIHKVGEKPYFIGLGPLVI